MIDSMRTARCARPLGLAALLLTFAALGADAQDRGNSGWSVRLAPYIWASNLGGAESLGLPADEQRFGDLLIPVEDTVLRGAWAVRAEVGKGRVRAWFNVSRAGLAKPAHMEREGDPPEHVLGEFDFSWFTTEAFAAIQVGPFATSHAFEVYAGGRYVRHEQAVTIGTAAPSEVTETWIEPAFGARLYAELGRRFWTAFNSDIGGFGIGSEFTWTLGGELGLRVIGPLDLAMRYNYQEAEYDNGKDGADAYAWSNGVQQGWFFGAVLKL